MQIYLPEPVELYGIRVGHTYNGLKYLIEHYTHTMSIATPKQLSDNDRAHCVKLIENLKLHVQLYDRQQAEQQTKALNQNN